MRVLLADDDPLCRRLLRACLQQWGHDPTEVADGEAAWEILRATGDEPWLAIVDWHMPGADGTEVCRRLRALPGDPLVYAILLTGRTSREDVAAGLQAGADDYVTKPFDRAELYARLQVGVRMLGMQQKLARQVRDLADALTRVKTLQGLIPLCCYCKAVRTDEDYWQQVEHYLAAHSELQFSHGICPKCYQDVVRPQLTAHHAGCDPSGCRERNNRRRS